MKLTKLTVALLGVGLLVTAAGCAGPASSAGKDGPSAQSSQMYAWISNQDDRAQWQTFIDGAKQKDPTFTLGLEGPSYEEFWTKVKTRMSAPDAPCIVTTQGARAQELKNILIPLDDLIKQAGIDVSAYNEGMIKGLTVDGTLRALPYDAEPEVLYYNKALFKAAGLKEPGTNYTRDQFLADAKALTTGDVMGFAASPGPGTQYLPVIYANGHLPVKGDTIQLDDPDVIDDIQWVFDLAAKHAVMKSPNSADSDDVARQAFQAGKVGMIIDGPWFYSTIMEGTKDEVGVAAIPSTTGKPIGVVQGSGFGIASTCPDPANAFANIAKITTAEVIGHVAEHRGTVPSLTSAFEAWGRGKPEADTTVIKALLADGVPSMSTSNWNQFLSLFTQYSSQGTRGERTAKQIMADISTALG